MSIRGGMSALFWMVGLLILEKDRGYFPPTELIQLPEAGACASLLSLPVLTGWGCRSWYHGGFSYMFLLLLAVPQSAKFGTHGASFLRFRVINFQNAALPWENARQGQSLCCHCRIGTSTTAGSDLGAKHRSGIFLHFSSMPWHFSLTTLAKLHPVCAPVTNL